MRKLLFKGLFLLFTCCPLLRLNAQTTTIFVFRHAEKDTSQPGSTQMQADPPLSKAGLERALKIPEILKNYRPDSIYSTNFTRTKETARPLLIKFNKSIQLYDPKLLKQFSEQLLLYTGKTIVVIGHSNTSPALVNLLIGENRYPNLADSVYNQYWMVTITDGKAEAKMLGF
ncbi:MAG: hypothetical protein RLZZ28_2688 [Bacteroidota bacterium]|jgi:broad specificity phosphatase PhoE